MIGYSWLWYAQCICVYVRLDRAGYGTLNAMRPRYDWIELATISLMHMCPKYDWIELATVRSMHMRPRYDWVEMAIVGSMHMSPRYDFKVSYKRYAQGIRVLKYDFYIEQAKFQTSRIL